MSFNYAHIFEKQFKLFFDEDDMNRNFNYIQSLPQDMVNCHLKIKDGLILAGLPFFFETFNYLSKSNIEITPLKFSKTTKDVNSIMNLILR